MTDHDEAYGIGNAYTRRRPNTGHVERALTVVRVAAEAAAGAGATSDQLDTAVRRALLRVAAGDGHCPICGHYDNWHGAPTGYCRRTTPTGSTCGCPGVPSEPERPRYRLSEDAAAVVAQAAMDPRGGMPYLVLNPDGTTLDLAGVAAEPWPDPAPAVQPTACRAGHDVTRCPHSSICWTMGTCGPDLEPAPPPGAGTPPAETPTSSPQPDAPASPSSTPAPSQPGHPATAAATPSTTPSPAAPGAGTETRSWPAVTAATRRTPPTSSPPTPAATSKPAPDRPTSSAEPSAPAAPSSTSTTGDPNPAGWPAVQGYCPACHSRSLFLGSGGHVTCSMSGCPDPSAAGDLLHIRLPR